MKNQIKQHSDLANSHLDFPALQQQVHGKRLVYLDSAASAQKPQHVIDTVQHFYQHDYSNVHRGVHALSERASAAYEQARDTVQQFINARARQEIVFVRSATEAINLVAQSYARPLLKAGDEIIISGLEHHANIVPWQLVCEQTGAQLRIIPLDQQGQLQLDAYADLFNPRTKLVALNYVSNALGTINPVQAMIEMAHSQGVPVLLDAAQAIPHMPVDVQALDCDFLAFTGHKVFGPSGIGVLYAKQDLLSAMPPYQGGGDMILKVTFAKTTYNELPYKFEAGTPNIEGAIGLAAALDYVSVQGMQNIAAYEHELLQYANQTLTQIPGLRIIGDVSPKAALISFVLTHAHAHDVGTILDLHGVGIRSGHHCAMPVMDHFGLAATARASFAFYNTKADIDALAAALDEVQSIFSK